MNIRFPGISMTARVSVAVLLVAVLPVAYAVWSLFDVNRSAMNEQVLRTHAVAASTAADRIANLVETRQTLARTLAANDRIATDASFLQEMLAAEGIHWPEIDEDISVAGLLRGNRAPKRSQSAA